MYGSSSIASSPIGSLSRTIKVALLQVAESDAEGVDFQGLTYLALGVADSESEGSDGQMLTYLVTTAANSEGEGIDSVLSASGNVLVSAGIATLEVEGLDADITYLVEDVPVLLLKRTSGTETEIDVENQEGRKIRIYKADSEQGLYSSVIVTDALPYTDSGLLATNNYKYKASFAYEGTKGGSSFTVEGRRGDPRFSRKTS